MEPHDTSITSWNGGVGALNCRGGRQRNSGINVCVDVHSAYESLINKTKFLYTLRMIALDPRSDSVPVQLGWGHVREWVTGQDHSSLGFEDTGMCESHFPSDKPKFVHNQVSGRLTLCGSHGTPHGFWT